MYLMCLLMYLIIKLFIFIVFIEIIICPGLFGLNDIVLPIIGLSFLTIGVTGVTDVIGVLILLIVFKLLNNGDILYIVSNGNFNDCLFLFKLLLFLFKLLFRNVLFILFILVIVNGICGL